MGKNVLITAPTGTAASNIGGVTVHHAFNLPTGPAFDSNMQPFTSISDELLITDILIIDEISMLRLDYLDSIYASLEAVAEQNDGHKIQVLLVGDFFQLPPIAPEDDGTLQILQKYYGATLSNGVFAFRASSWTKFHFKNIILIQNIRQGDDLKFQEALEKIRTGDSSCIDYFNENSSSEVMLEAPNIYQYNVDVRERNITELAKLNYPSKVYKLNSFGVPAYKLGNLNDELVIKKKARAMITANDSTGQNHGNMRFHNGSLGTIKEYDDKTITIKLDNDEIIKITRIYNNIYRYRVREDNTLIRK